MEITEVRVKLMDEPGERLQAFCSITFDDAFVVRDLKIIEGTSGPFVAMPSRKLTAHCSNCGCKNHLRAAFCNQCGTRLRETVAFKDEDGRAKLYADIAHPINSVCREMIQQQVIEAFSEEKRRSKVPGYIPSYEDFDHPPALSTHHEEKTQEKEPDGETTQVQGAEKPRGPHTMPGHTPSSKKHTPKGFGAGVFD